MIENFGGSIVYLILFLIQLLGLAFYSYLILFTPKTVTSDYGFGESAVPVVRLIGSFIIPFVFQHLLHFGGFIIDVFYLR